jgi:hypothetical protein
MNANFLRSSSRTRLYAGSFPPIVKNQSLEGRLGTEVQQQSYFNIGCAKVVSDFNDIVTQIPMFPTFIFAVRMLYGSHISSISSVFSFAFICVHSRLSIRHEKSTALGREEKHFVRSSAPSGSHLERGR